MNPKKQSTDTIVAKLLVNKSHQYTEAAHAEIFRRLIATIKNFNLKAEKIEKVMLVLAAAQVILALAQIFLALR
ncbi:MAG: hypothetical protein U1C50_01640 [Patescibacteria group bacterium]|nr:hypothetical protein [Candidatus Beckwithbacteria bacterium]MDZ4228937.1 hypothetical protein [Patescibacteria group bacterium]